MLFLSLVSLFSVVILAMMIPGPDFVIVLRSSLRYGRGSGFIVALGIASGNLTQIVLTVSLLNYLQEHFLFILDWISLFGGCYLLYIAYKCYRASQKSLNLNSYGEDEIKISRRYLYLSGLLCNLTNPKAIIFFLSILPIFILKCSSLFCHLAIILTVFLAAVFWFGLVSFVMGSKRVRKLFISYIDKLELIFTAVLLVFGIYLIYSGVLEIFKV